MSNNARSKPLAVFAAYKPAARGGTARAFLSMPLAWRGVFLPRIPHHAYEKAFFMTGDAGAGRADEAICSLCGQRGPFAPFFPGASLRETRCPSCGASRRTRDVARVLLQEYSPSLRQPLCKTLDRLRGLAIYELQARGALHDQLRELPGYCCSEYFPAVLPGVRNDAGVLCQDVTALTFADASFDLVISQDILEHLADPWRGVAEISRVLRPGGRHIFTVPVHEGRRTRQRARRGPGGKVEHLFPPVCHNDPLDPDGALVFWDYGDDMAELLHATTGERARRAYASRWYGPERICDVCDEAQYRSYLLARENKGYAGFFLYNSNVFILQKAL